ncbi:3',5'-cyclic-nucleotide phosphodiesterase [Geobacter sp. SVR]|uniref:3',5'-cyclic-nucleotide phosphodiesterase n=1 Tax=Geobacter sp. SVR TaxID=2495594 RepID=UPI00143F01A6|nr:3',5'-cyclic-nucleotide phosphodiesterase [Geobacter sp. SVR]BCS53808.1 cAMP phosphodiesterase class-II:metallo-beta-lactamase superfamily protein [Geobacter sp. SVR]GCF85683.1 cAMP phosphodiesterase class-II:metallo-beta-lactamase superfamily protein [Geobacter sp. SVR]
MRLRILGSAGAELPDFRPPAFLIDEHLLLDAGTIGSVLTEEDQLKLRNIFITHSHLDHIRGIPALADNIIIRNLDRTVNIFSTQPVISALRDHLFNGVIWPDFTRIPTPEHPVLCFNMIVPGQGNDVAGYSITAVEVHHTVPAVGYIVAKDGVSLAYTGDTGPTDIFWRHVSGADALIVEVSFPDNMEELALLTQHLTCSLLRRELKKIGTLPRRVLITHPKPQYYDTIKREIENLGMPEIELLHDGAVFDL